MRTFTALTLAFGLLATSFTASIAAPVVSQSVIQGSDTNTAVSQVKMSKKQMMMMKKKKMMMKKKMM